MSVDRATKQRRADGENFGLSAKEEQIMDALDAGERAESVALRFGTGLSTILTMERRYTITTGMLTDFDRRTRASDARYRAALAASGGAYS
ncbi:hypothetical protein [Sphingomonas paucimobilis]|uniref:Uncharacterized protein n=1 Tax=Sphingomonas paucimobilis TaxID=13689 RepID=A0A7T3AC48_SPHPI|nr:hypothetical protein [Sphingomonas paucimobilis]QPT09842.1 hypothetical protein I6G38_06265 [Sphingomonas paucimobilis]